jgi:hypothetical protein
VGQEQALQEGDHEAGGDQIPGDYRPGHAGQRITLEFSLTPATPPREGNP